MAKEKGVYKGGKKKYHAEAKRKDKVVYDEVVRLLKQNESVMNIHRKTGVSRNTIYGIKKDLSILTSAKDDDL
nr:helix-turn-helix domain-containing protein [Domibacillus antri]